MYPHFSKFRIQSFRTKRWQHVAEIVLQSSILTFNYHYRLLYTGELLFNTYFQEKVLLRVPNGLVNEFLEHGLTVVLKQQKQSEV